MNQGYGSLFSAILFSILLTLVRSTIKEDQPLASEDGDFILVGLMNSGEIVSRNVTSEDGVVYSETYCSYAGVAPFGLQKMIVFRDVVQQHQARFAAENWTLGYEIYSTCSSYTLSSRVANLVAANNKVVGVAGVDYKSFTKRISAQITAFNIPIFNYMYNDQDLMDIDKYPSVFSLVDIKENEGNVIMQFLETLKFEYIDIWYHRFSEVMAFHIYQNYALGRGGYCGRMAEVTSEDDIPRITEFFSNTESCPPADVQLILSNSDSVTALILKHMIDTLGLRGKVYMLGMSNGKMKNLKKFGYGEILLRDKTSSLVFPLATLLNADQSVQRQKLSQQWTSGGEVLDGLCKTAQEQCPDCFTGWLAYIIAGTETLARALFRELKDVVGDRNVDIMKLRKRIIARVVDEEKTTTFDLNNETRVNLRFKNRVLDIGYELGVYSPRADEFKIFAKAFSSSIEIKDDITMQSFESYGKRCSETCEPGSEAVHKATNSSKHNLHCCWNCRLCPFNSISVNINSRSCESCRADQYSNENRTLCNEVEHVFIGPIYLRCAAVLAILAVVLCILLLILVVKKKSRPTVMASDAGYLVAVLISLILGFVTSCIPLLQPSQITCSVEYFAVITFATTLMINLVWKCYKVYRIFTLSSNFKKPKCMILFRLQGQIILNFSALAFNLFLAVMDTAVLGPGWVYSRTQNPHQHIHLICESSSLDKIPITIAPLVLPALSFLTTLYLAYKMRSFPHNFRETLNIFFASATAAVCCIMFLGGYYVSDLRIKGLLRAIVLFVTSLAFLVCLFVPRALILLDKNIDIEKERQMVKAEVHSYAARKACLSSISKSSMKSGS